MNKLSVRYDPQKDIIEIEGTKYSGGLFRQFGLKFPGNVGNVLRIDKMEDGVITVTRINPSDKDIINVALENGIDCRPPRAREEGITPRGANIIRFARALLRMS
jgi:hypothetical protein